MSVLVPVIFFILLLFFLPIRVNLIINANLMENKVEFEAIDGLENKVKVKLIYIFNIFTKDIFLKKQKNKSKDKKKNNKPLLVKALYKSLTFPKFLLSTGFNTYNMILNSYINALLNSTLCIYINQNSRKFNFKELYYQIYLANVPVVLNMDITADVVPIKFILNYIYLHVKKSKTFKESNKNTCKKCIS